MNITTRDQERTRWHELNRQAKGALVVQYQLLGSLTPQGELLKWRKDELISQILFVERGYKDQVPA